MIALIWLSTAISVASIMSAAVMYIENIELLGALVDIRHKAARCTIEEVKVDYDPDPTEIIPGRKIFNAVWN
jgi:hypothetical protein